MKKTRSALLHFICLVISMLLVTQTKAQSEETSCGTTEHMEYLKMQRPDLERQLQQSEVIMQQWIDAHPNLRSNGLTDTIPVVVHVVWRTSGQNISTQQVLNTILALNQDYGRTAPDTGNTPAVWKPIAASTGIQFCLAKRDPFGAPTDGIERRQTTSGPFTTNDLVKSYASGGLDAWDVTKYFNIWICDLSAGLGGYGEFPTAFSSNTFGNVTDYTLVGINGWVASHESGHCFSLRHIWADDAGACTGSDLVGDTPNQANATSAPCPTFPALDACQTASPGIMFMNYMDYGSSSCKNIFTEGQAARVQAALHSLAYASLLTSNGCDSVILEQTDAGSPAIITPSGLLCSTSITPVVRLRNWGTDALFSATLNYQLDANPLQTYSWSGAMPSLATVDIILPVESAGPGAHSFVSYTTNPNGLVDGNAFNDTSFSSFDVVLIGDPTPFSYGFEPAAFPPTEWTLDNQDGAVSWARTTGAAKTGIASMWFNSINYTCNGCIDIITLPGLDLTTTPSPQMTFQVAYQMLSNPAGTPSWSDSLRVDVSTDCGLTWTNLYFKYSTNLTTIIPTFSTTAFVPTQNDWRLETIDLSPYAGNENVMLRFKVSSDYENNLYVDDVSIHDATTVGVSESTHSATFAIYPNPAKDLLSLSFRDLTSSAVKIDVRDIAGKIVLTKNVNHPAQKIELNVHSLNAGIYFIAVSTGDGSYNQKFEIVK